MDQGGDLVEFAFEASLAPELTPACLARLARESWSFCTRAGLTGEQRLQDGRITKVVEGSCAEVLKLAARILNDSRHGAVRILAFRPVAERRHRGWTTSGFDLGAAAVAEAAQPPAGNLRVLRTRRAA